MPRELLSEEEKKRRRSERSKKHYEKNKELIRARQKEYYAENREKIRADQTSAYWADREPGSREKYYEDLEKRREEKRNKPKFVPLTEEEKKARDTERRKRYYAENKEEIDRKSKIYRDTHKEELKAKSAKYTEEHREEINRKAREYGKKNKERNAERSRVYRQSPTGKAKKRESDRRKNAREHGAEVFPMPDNYEDTLFENQGGLCYYCKKPFNKELMLVTHIVLHSNGGPHSFDNVVLSCQECILRKGQRTSEEFLLEVKFDDIEGFAFCKKCNRVLPIENFSRDRSRRNGIASQCKECTAIAAQERKDQYNAERNASDLPDTKVCTKCLLELPISDFHNSNSTKDGKSPHCKECARKISREYYAENAEEIREKERKRREENRDEEAALARKYPLGIPKYGFKFCRHCEKELPLDAFYKNKVSRDGRHSWCISCVKERYDEHIEERREYGRKYGKEHAEERREYYKENKDRINAKRKAIYDTPEGKAKDKARVDLRRARRKKAAIEHLPNNYRKTLFENQNGLCYYCGCDLNEVQIDLDHKTPLSRGGAHSFENLCLACSTCNRRKWSMTEEEYRATLEDG